MKVKKIISIGLSAAIAASVLMTGGVSASAATVKAPASLKAANTSTGVKLTWKAGKGAKKYVVKRKISTAKKYTALKTTTKLTFTDKTAKAGKIYTYSVASVNGKSTKAATKKIVRLAAPTSVTAKVVKAEYGDKVKISWKKSAGAKSYNVYRAKVSGTKVGKYESVSYSNTTSATDYIFESGKTYKYKVTAVKGSSESAMSAASAKLLYLEPVYTPLVVLNEDRTALNVSWDKTNGAKGYRIYRSDNGGKFKLVSDSASYAKETVDGYTTYTYTDTDLVYGSSYSYYVIAYNGSVKSTNAYDASAETKFTEYDYAVQVGESSTLFSAYKLIYEALGAEFAPSSSNEEVFTVKVEDSSVVLTGVSAGDADLIFGNDPFGMGAEMKFRIRVSEEPAYDVILKAGESRSLSGDRVMNFSLDNSISITSDNEEVVKVTDGKLVAVSEGAAKVNVKAPYGETEMELSLRVKVEA